MISRRGLITGLVSLVAAPAIVRVTSIMPVKSYEVNSYLYPTKFEYSELEFPYVGMRLWSEEIAKAVNEYLQDMTYRCMWGDGDLKFGGLLNDRS